MSHNPGQASSLIYIRVTQAFALLKALDYEADDAFSLEQNVFDCLGDIGWQYTTRQDDCLGFQCITESNEEMDWQALLNMTPYLEDGSYYEMRCGDYVESLQGSPCPGIARAWVENGELHGQLYALVDDEHGRRARQLVGVFDPRMI